MAKRKAPGAIRIRTKVDGVIFDDYGILTEVSLDGNNPPALLEKNIRAIREAPRPRALTALEKVHGLRAQMQQLISLAVMPDNATELPAGRWATISADLGDGPKTHVCRADRQAGIEEAAAVLWEVLMLGNPNEREAEVFWRGLNAGRLLERMQFVLPAEPDALKGKRAVNRAAEMRETRATDTETQRGKIEAAVQTHLDANPRNTLSHARKMAAADLDVSVRSVLRATKNLKK